ncbi:MAG: outer membrane beta-barrel protein [Pseudomonadota bacterium]
MRRGLALRVVVALTAAGLSSATAFAVDGQPGKAAKVEGYRYGFPFGAGDVAAAASGDSGETEIGDGTAMLTADAWELPGTATGDRPLLLAQAAAPSQGATPEGGYLEVPRDQTVRERPRPEVEPLGIHVGSFFTYPSVTITEFYNDNVFATSSNKKGDFITEISPDLQVKSDWNNHALNFDVGAASGFYADNTDEDYTDYHALADGRLDITRDHQLTAGLGYRHEHLDRTSPDNIQSAKEPVTYDLYTAALGNRNQFGRFTVEINGELDRYDYSDVQAVGGGTIDYDQLDRIATTGSAKVSYEIVPDYHAYLRTTYNNQRYDGIVPTTGLDKDSQGYEAVAGMAIDLGGITRADVFAGYQQQFYEDSSLGTIEGPSGGASLTWNVTGITTVNASLTRTLAQTIVPGAAGYYSTDAKLSVDHELLRNLLLNVFGEYDNRDYQGINRTDEVWSAGAGAQYLMNRYVWLTGNYRFDQRNSDAGGQDYNRNVFLVGIKLQM